MEIVYLTVHKFPMPLLVSDNKLPPWYIAVLGKWQRLNERGVSRCTTRKAFKRFILLENRFSDIALRNGLGALNAHL